MYRLMLILFILPLSLTSDMVQKSAVPTGVSKNTVGSVTPTNSRSKKVLQSNKVLLANPIVISDILYYSASKSSKDGFSLDDYVNGFSSNHDTFGSKRANGKTFEAKNLTTLVDLKSTSTSYKGVVYDLKELSPLKKDIFENHIKKMPHAVGCMSQNKKVTAILYLHDYQSSFSPVSSDVDKVKIDESVKGYHFLLSECQQP